MPNKDISIKFLADATDFRNEMAEVSKMLKETGYEGKNLTQVLKQMSDLKGEPIQTKDLDALAASLAESMKSAELSKDTLAGYKHAVSSAAKALTELTRNGRLNADQGERVGEMWALLKTRAIEVEEEMRNMAKAQRQGIASMAPDTAIKNLLDDIAKFGDMPAGLNIIGEDMKKVEALMDHMARKGQTTDEAFKALNETWKKGSRALKDLNAQLNKPLAPVQAPKITSLEKYSGLDDAITARLGAINPKNDAAYSMMRSDAISQLSAAMRELSRDGYGADTMFKRLSDRYNELTLQQKRADNSFKTLVPRLKGEFIRHAALGAYSAVVSILSRDIPAAIAKSIEAASRAYEANNLYMATFDRIPKMARKAAAEVSDSFGLAASTAQEGIGQFAQLMVGMGESQDAALEFGKKAMETFLDIKSFKNINTSMEDFLNSVRSGLSGNYQNFKAMGLAINQSAINDRLKAKGLDALTGSARKAASAQEALNLAMEQSKDAAGDYQRNYYSIQNVNQRLSEQSKQFAANIGEMFAPIVNSAKKWLSAQLEMANTAQKVSKYIESLSSKGTDETRGMDEQMRKNVSSAVYESLSKRGEYFGLGSDAFQDEKLGKNASEKSIKAAKQAIDDVSRALGLSATQVAKLAFEWDKLPEAVRQYAEEMDGVLQKERDAEELAQRRASALAAANKSRTDLIGNLSSISGISGTDTGAITRGAIGADPRSFLSAYQKAIEAAGGPKTDMKEVYDRQIQALKAMWEELNNSRTLAKSKLAADDGTLGYSAMRQYNQDILDADENMPKLIAAIVDLTAKSEALSTAFEADELLAQKAKKMAEDLDAARAASKQYMEGLRGTAHENALNDKYKGSPYASALVERDKAMEELVRQSADWFQKGMPVEESRRLVAEAKGYIQDAYDRAVEAIDLAKRNEEIEHQMEIRNKEAEARGSAESYLGGLKDDLRISRWQADNADNPYASALLSYAQNLDKVSAQADQMLAAGLSEEYVQKWYEDCATVLRAILADAEAAIDKAEEERKKKEALQARQEMAGTRQSTLDAAGAAYTLGGGGAYSQRRQLRRQLQERLQNYEGDNEAQDEAVKAYEKQDADLKKQQYAYFSQKAAGFADQMTGGIVSGAVEGASAAGPIGGIVGALSVLFEKMQAFKIMTKAISIVVEALNDAFAPMEPFLELMNEQTRIMASQLKGFTPILRTLAKALSYVSTVVNIVVNTLIGFAMLVKGFVLDLVNKFGKVGDALRTFVKHALNPFKWGKLGGDANDIKDAFENLFKGSMSNTSDAWNTMVDTNKELLESLDGIGEKVDGIQKSSATTASNTAKDKVAAWRDMMYQGLITGAEFASLSRNAYGTRYGFGRTDYTATNYAARGSRTVQVGSVNIEVQGSADPEATAVAVANILNRRLVYGYAV